MAAFDGNLISKIGIGDEINIKKISSYLYQLNDQLKYMFQNLNPDENWSSDSYIKYLEQDGAISKLEISVDRISLEMISKDNLISSINLSKEGVKIQGAKISLEGVVTANNYFKINTDGSMSCTNGTFSGTVNASKILGAAIEGELSIACGERFWVSDLDRDNYEIGIGAFQATQIDYSGRNSYHGDSFGSQDSQIFMGTNGCLYCKDIYFPENPWMKGWSLIATLKDIYSKLGSSSDGDVLPDGEVEG